jgi:hypothetical protein
MTAWCLWWRVSAAGLRLRTVARERSGGQQFSRRLGLEVEGAAPLPPLIWGAGRLPWPLLQATRAAARGEEWGASLPPPLLEGSPRVSPRAGRLGL